MRLIEKFSESIKVLNDYRNLYHAESSSTEQYKVANAINDILPEFCRLIESDAEPVVHGHWIDQDSDCENWHIHQYECSKCGMGDRHNSNVNVPYCWFCGAKMDEEKCET